MGESVGKAVAPTIGSIQAAVRAAGQQMADAKKEVEKVGGGAGEQAGIKIKEAIQGIKLSAGLDIRSSEGYSEFLRLKFGGSDEAVAERTAEAAERTADATEDVASKLNFSVVGFV
jgi:hypothetical protein